MIERHSEVRPQLSLEQEEFQRGLAAAIDLFSANGLDYRIIGSGALHGIVPDLDFNPVSASYKAWRSPHRDIDVIFPQEYYRQQKNALQGLINGFNDKFYPSFLDDFLSRNGWVNLEEFGVSLAYYRYRVKVPLSVFDPYRAELFDVEFVTVPPPTLFHILGLVGELREEDRENALILGRWLRKNPVIQYPEESYQGFHEFYKGKRKKFPFHAWWMHRRHLKETEPEDTVGQVYKALPTPLKFAQREISKFLLWAEGQIVA